MANFKPIVNVLSGILNKLSEIVDLQKPGIKLEKPVIKKSDLQNYITKAEILAFLKITDRTYYRMKRAGILHPIKIGGQDFYRMEDLFKS